MVKILAHMDGLMQKRRNSIADAPELRLFSANRSPCQYQCQRNAISKLLYSGITASNILHTRDKIDTIHKFHNAPLPHPISVEQKYARFCSKVVHFMICDWSIFGTPNNRWRMTPLWWGICCVSKITICKINAHRGNAGANALKNINWQSVLCNLCAACVITTILLHTALIGCQIPNDILKQCTFYSPACDFGSDFWKIFIMYLFIFYHF